MNHRMTLPWLVVAAGLCGCGHPDKPAETAQPEQQKKVADAAGEQLKRIRVETVEAMTVPVDEVTAPGNLEVNQNRVSHVMLPLSGRVVSVLAKLGDPVREGQPLLAVESAEADAAQTALQQADASITQGKAALLKAQADLERVTDLFAHNAMAKKEVLSAENQVAQAKAGLTQAEAAREQTSRRVKMLGLEPGALGQKVTVRAPLTGKILAINVAQGEYRNDTNAPLMTVADLSTLWINSNVPEPYIRFCRVGGAVDVELAAYPGETFHARVTHIGETLDPQTRTVKVRGELNNSSGRFRPEMFGQVRYTEAVKAMPVVDSRAIVQSGGKSFVYVEQSPGKFERREVTTGKRLGEKTVIQSGLAAGERVAAEGAIYLQGGA